MNEIECCVCYEENKELLKCKHNLCNNCYKKIYILECPICRKNITSQYYYRFKSRILMYEYVSFLILQYIGFLTLISIINNNINNETIKAFIFSIIISIYIILIIIIINLFILI